MTNCCNPKHEKPIPAEYVVVDGHNQPHFLCDLCSWILDNLGELHGFFIEEIAEWEENQLTPEEKIARDWEEWGDKLYDESIGT